MQYLVMSIDRLDEKRNNQKQILFVNGKEGSSKLVAYIYKNRLYFSIYEYDENVEWLVSTPSLKSYLGRELQITLTWQRDKYFSLHVDGLLLDMLVKPLASPLNQDIYQNANGLNKLPYEFGVRSPFDQPASKVSKLDKAISNTIGSHQFTLKYLRRDYYNDLDSMDSKVIVSSPLPSEIIRIDNTQRVMYKIDSPLTGVTTETIELSFRTSQSDGVIFYIKNNPIISYFELIKGKNNQTLYIRILLLNASRKLKIK